ncbi:MAG: hypothetical protein IIW55_00470 [Bacteroidales bacterium]|nr:hypothetical protein [Bacteroidales bacterium]
MKKTLLFLFCLLLSFNVFSQEKKFRPVQINFGFPLSTINVKKAKEYTNAFSINLLVGISKNERSLALAGISNVIANNATGLQIASVSNYIGNAGYGIEVAGVTNINKGSYNGIQASGVYNYSGLGNGIAVAGVANMSKGSYNGIQASGVYNYSGSGNGIAVAGVANMSKGSYNGIQASGVYNYSGSGYGIAVAGVANMSKGSYIGLQLSGVTNIAGDVKGLQFAGVMNIAKNVKGVQFATIFNVAEESDFPIAFINIIKNGKMGVALSYDNMNNTMLSFRSGGKYSYGILGVGYNNKVNDGSNIVAEAGYGIHIPIINWLEINNEFKATSLGFSNDKVCYNASYLLAPSFTFLNHFNVFGGASFNYLYSNYVNSDDLLPNNYLFEKDNSDNKQRMFIGYQIGLQYVF